jgi:predicted ATP-grasp superfamily ATP-dependent carboligase
MPSPSVLIAAPSGRALAASARRAGYLPLVADYFGDEDTLALAQAHVRIQHGLARGMDADAVIAAFETLAIDQQPVGVVWSGGFEDRPHVLARIAQRWPLLGNDPQTVETIKDPLAFDALCRAGGIPHPETMASRPSDPSGWLVKRRGGSGGSHIATTVATDVDAAGFYFQRAVPGVPVSALFVADGERAMVLGFSRQWASPTPAQPFRWGGAVRPADLTARMTELLTDAVDHFVQSIPLVGLNSADFLVDGDQFRLLEINPRPSAAIDIFEPAEGSLFALHLAACDEEMGAAPPALHGACAAATVYADCDIASLSAWQWPDWIADRSPPGTAFKAGDPLCTVKAAAPTAAAAKALVDERLATVLAWTHAKHARTP